MALATRPYRMDRASLLAVAIFAIGATVYALRVFGNGPTLKLADGTDAADLSVHEAGEFSGKQFEAHRQSYLLNLKTYKKLTAPVAATTPAEVEQSLAPLLARALAAEPKFAAATQQAGERPIKSLSRHMATLLWRCTGVASNDYLAQLNGEVQFHLPTNSAVIEHTGRTYLAGFMPPASAADQAAMRAAFEQFYAAGASFNSGASAVNGWAGSIAGIRAGIWETTDAEDADDLLSSSFDDATTELFVGRLSQGQLVFTGPAKGGPDAASKPAGSRLRAEVLIIVQTRGGDCYPIGFMSFYDRANDTWWLTRAVRESSVRMANSPPFAF